MSSFSRQFTKPIQQAAVVECKAAKSVNKFSLAAFKGDGKFFWEELKNNSHKKIVNSHKKIVRTTIDEGIKVAKEEPSDVSTSSSTEVYVSDPKVSLLHLSPNAVALQSDILRCKHASDLLLLIDQPMDAIHVATCLLRIVQKADTQPISVRRLVFADPRFSRLMDSVGNYLQTSQDPVWLSNVLYALSKAKLAPAWLPELITRTMETVPAMELEQIGSCLYSVASLPGHVDDLIDLLVDAARKRPVVANHQFVSICTSLARLGRADKHLFRTMSDALLIEDMTMNDVTSVLWAFTKSKQTDSVLFAKICQALEQRVGECSGRHLVTIVWALAKSNTNQHELFRFTLAPAIRQFMPELTVRELCTVLWSFSSLSISDPDFYNDLALMLLPQVNQMNAHDVSSVTWGLSSVDYRNGALHSALRKQAALLKNDFSPLQLSRVIYGLSSSDMGELVLQAKRCMHLLYTQNIVEILIGLDRAGLADKMAADFLAVLETQCERISGRDAVQILSVLGNCSNASLSYFALIEKLTEIVTARFNCSGRWIPTGFDLIDLLTAMGSLGLTQNTEFLEQVLLHFSTLYRSPSFTPDLFVRLVSAMGVLAESPTGECKRTISKLLLLRQNGIATGFAEMTGQLLAVSHLLKPNDGAELVQLFSKLNYCDENILKIAEAVGDHYELLSVENKAHLLTAFVQLGIQPECTIERLHNFPYEDGMDGETVLNLIWAQLALGEPPQNVHVGNFKSFFPKNIFRAKQVIHSLGPQSGNANWSEFVAEVGAVRADGSKKFGAKSKLLRCFGKHSVLISQSLAQLGVVHKHESKVWHYTVTAWLRSADAPVILDLAESESVVTPLGTRFTGEKILKNIHLSQKYLLVNLRMREVQTALEANSLGPFLADRLAPYSEKAKERVSFRKMHAIAEDIMRLS